MPRIKYIQAGTGHAHASKISVYRRSEDYEVVGVVEPDAGLRKRAEASSLYQDLPFLALDDALGRGDVQVIGVETRVRDSLDVAEKCVAAGKHIHLDKPAGESLAQFKRILDSAAAQHLAVQMGYMYRYSPAVLLLREMLGKGWLGEPFEVHMVMSKLNNAAARQELAEYAGGTMFELGCHLIDLVVGMLGAPTAVHAYPRHSSEIEDTLQDNMLAVFEYPRATATVRSSVNEVEGFARRHFTLCGTEGTFHIQPLDNPKVQLALGAPRDGYKQGYQEITLPKFPRYVADAADLAKIIRHQKEPVFNYEHDLVVQRAVLAASDVNRMER